MVLTLSIILKPVMHNNRKTIFTGLGPNYQPQDVASAARLLFQPWHWLHGNASTRLAQAWQERFSGEAYVFSSGRGALWALLQAAGVQPGDEVLLQAFTCVAVVEPVLWMDASPVFVDVDPDYATMSPDALRSKITSRSKVLIVQHTFGAPADLDQLLSIARQHGLIVIEDCAHALGARYRNELVGSFGDAAFYSLGRDKVISSVFGGIAVPRRADIADRLRVAYEHVPMVTRAWTVQQLLHPIIIGLVKATYDFFALGKLILRCAQRCGLISMAVYPIERSGGRPWFITRRLPNALAQLALGQLARLDAFNEHRQKIAEVYTEVLAVHHYNALLKFLPETESIFLRYAITADARDQIIQILKKHSIIAGDWYTNIIAPHDVDLEKIGYTPGSCPHAERLARRVFNLPTDCHVSIDTARRIAMIVDRQLTESN